VNGHQHHLRIVEDVPPDIDDDDGGGGDDGEDMVMIEVGISGSDDVFHGARVLLPAGASPEAVAQELLMTMRGAVAAYDVDVQLALERRLLHWGDQSER
jgi:hypothetical protein